MKKNEVGGLLFELWQDVQQPDALWQVGVLLLCLGWAWLAHRLVQRRAAAAPAAEGRRAQAWRLGQGGLQRLVFPLVALFLVLLARPLLAQWHHVNLLSVAVPLLASLAVIRAVFFALRCSFAQARWLAAFERGFALFAWSIVALHITGLLPQLIDLFESVGYTVGKQKLNLWMMLQALGAMLATLLAALWAGGLIEARLMAAEGMDSNLRFVLARIAKALLIVLAVLIGLPAVGIDLTMLSVFGGALGVGLGFGLQKIAANYISGFIILLDRSLRIGDTIAVGGEKGQVTKITTRYTVLRGLAGIEAIVPNEVLVSSIVLNESYTDPKVRISLSVQVGYASDIERAMQLMIAAAAAQPSVLADPAPSAFVTAFADSGIELELAFWVGDAAAGRAQVRSDINLALWRAFRAEGIEIPFPQREVRILGAAAPDPTKSPPTAAGSG